MDTTERKINHYIAKWSAQGYESGIPDEAPLVLARQGLAPSYKAIAECLLKNDLHMEGIGFAGPKSLWYSAIKKNEIEMRGME